MTAADRNGSDRGRTASVPSTAASPAAPPPDAPPERRGGILVPTWAAIVVAVLLIGGLGFAIGYWTGDDDGSDAANASSSQLAPNRQGPFSNGGGSNGGTVPNGERRTATGTGRPPRRSRSSACELENAANNGGASISSVRAGSPAADAGLKTGDVVTKIDDTTVADDDDLIRAIRAHKPGDEVTVTYTRDGTSAQVKVTLGDRSDATRQLGFALSATPRIRVAWPDQEPSATYRLTFTAWPRAPRAPTPSSPASTRRAPRRSSCRCRRTPTLLRRPSRRPATSSPRATDSRSSRSRRTRTTSPTPAIDRCGSRPRRATSTAAPRSPRR